MSGKTNRAHMMSTLRGPKTQTQTEGLLGRELLLPMGCVKLGD